MKTDGFATPLARSMGSETRKGPAGGSGAPLAPFPKGGPLGEVRAHKNIIMMVSPVFRRKLLENEDMFTEVIVVPDTTLAAFQAMINMVYQKQTVTTIFRRLGLRDMFQTLSLAQRYDITMMQETMVEHFSRLVITQ